MISLTCVPLISHAALNPQNAMVQQEQLVTAHARQETRMKQFNSLKVVVEGSKTKSSVQKTETSLQKTSFFIQKIQIQPDLKELSFLKSYMQKHEQKTLSVININQLVQSMNQTLLDKGYVTTQVRIPEQNISHGILQLEVLPGKLKNVIYSPDSLKIPWKTAFPIRKGQLLNIRKLEQGLEQMKRVTSRDVTMRLLPGNTIGTSNIELTIRETDKPIHAFINIDNSGLKATGKTQINTSFSIDNPLQSNDILKFNFGGYAIGEGQIKQYRNQSVDYSIAHDWNTYSLSYSKYKYKQLTTSLPYNFFYSGKTQLIKFSWNHVFKRTQTKKSSFDISIQKRTAHSYINDMEIPVQALSMTSLELAVSDRIYIKNSTLYARLAQRFGVSWLGAQDNYDNADVPNSQYRMWLLDLDYYKPFLMGHRPANYTVSFHGQWNTGYRRLYSVDQLNIGNRYTVRGFDGEYTLMGENGWYLSQELVSIIPLLHSEIYLGFDIGSVYGVSTDVLVGNSIAGAVIGIRGNFKSGLGYDVYIGVPLYKPDGYRTHLINTGYSIYCRF
ncbi:ShlB/FhaC/HecB family hemolysin secretion/activation protein [Veillonella montpellierensis]|uniref:ShlB/FhaC/HecB family hemolysin secretion/activation protein n=1 Tax=Veillonella montpellierensis TaxID=187328 RepID=UPI0023F623C5|nr:ShlB/FhaC/HecB family hemolysin secretion/activation protein [Veillonella montpellierensis]